MEGHFADLWRTLLACSFNEHAAYELWDNFTVPWDDICEGLLWAGSASTVSCLGKVGEEKKTLLI